MSANISRPPTKENTSTALTSGIGASDLTITLNSVTTLVAPCYLVIDRVDSAGALKSFSTWEYVKVTAINGNDCTVTRGQGGSTGQSHSAAAIVESVSTAAMFTEWYPVLNTEHDANGTHLSLASITDARINNSLNVSGASITGFQIVPVFTFTGALSGPTTLLQTPVVMPRTGTWNFVNFLTRTVASGASAIVDVNLNGTSIFDAGTRPSIAGGGTLVSTASILTKAFTRGDRLSWDYDTTGGLITDFNIQLVSN